MRDDGHLEELRQKARQFLIQLNQIPEGQSQEVQKLVEELNIHQIELEMQNQELRQTQAELERNSLRYRNLYDFAPVALLTLDKRGAILDMNRTASMLLNVDKSFVIGMPFVSFVQSQSRGDFYAHVNQVFKQEGFVNTVIKVESTDGKRSVMQMQSVRFREENHLDYLCRVAATDLTRQVEAEEKLKQFNQHLESMVQVRTVQLEEELRQRKAAQEESTRSQAVLKAFFESSPHLFLMVDPELRVLEFNRITEEFRLVEDIGMVRRGMASLSFFPPDYRDYFAHSFRMAFLGNRQKFEIQLAFASGPRWYEASISPVFDELEQIFAASLIMQDIQTRKASELQSKSIKKQLQTTLQNLEGFIFRLKKKKGRFVFELAEGKLASEFGLRESRVEGLTLAQAFGDKMGAELEAIYQKALDGQLQSLEMPVNGRWFSNIFSIYEELEQRSLIVSGRETTHRRIAEMQTQEALKKEQETNLLRDRFVSTVSHEFRTPLALISSNIQILQKHREAFTAQERSEMLTEMLDSVKQMTNMLDKLAMVRESKDYFSSFEPVEVDFHSFCEELVRDLDRITPKKIPVSLKYKAKPRQVLDVVLMRHILTNLVSNAKKFTSKGSISLSVADSADGQRLEIEVEDTGMGIPEADQPFIFEAFVRASNTDGTKGSGLGLSITKNCVQVHQGTIEASSKLGRGTKMRIEIPKTDGGL